MAAIGRFEVSLQFACLGLIATAARGRVRCKAGKAADARSMAMTEGVRVAPRFSNRTPAAKEAALVRLQDFAAAKGGR